VEKGAPNGAPVAFVPVPPATPGLRTVISMARLVSYDTVSGSPGPSQDHPQRLIFTCCVSESRRGGLEFSRSSNWMSLRTGRAGNRCLSRTGISSGKHRPAIRHARNEALSGLRPVKESREVSRSISKPSPYQQFMRFNFTRALGSGHRCGPRYPGRRARAPRPAPTLQRPAHRHGHCARTLRQRSPLSWHAHRERQCDPVLQEGEPAR
jgi:hypothetical protein